MILDFKAISNLGFDLKPDESKRQGIAASFSPNRISKKFLPAQNLSFVGVSTTCHSNFLGKDTLRSYLNKNEKGQPQYIVVGLHGFRVFIISA